MAKNRRYVLFSLFAATLLLPALVFRQVLLDNVVLPLATVVWLFLRIFVLSIDQEVYWWGLILLVVLFLLNRLLGEPGPAGRNASPETNPTLERVSFWRNSIRSNVYERGRLNDVRKDLADLLVTAYSTGQGAAQAEIKQALAAREILLSDPVYAFLFAGDPAVSRPGFLEHPIGCGRHILRSARPALNRWRRRWTGREAAEYYQAIQDVMTLIESSPEIKDDHGLHHAENAHNN